MKDVHGVLNIAASMAGGDTPESFTAPAIAGVEGLLQSIEQFGKDVKRVIHCRYDDDGFADRMFDGLRFRS